ncbi:MAG: sialidase family protein [Armatimonadota bacterium]|nr:sialidase family protein [Armatimonadota bacterium]
MMVTAVRRWLLLGMVLLTMSASAEVQTTEDYIVPEGEGGYFNPSTVYATNEEAPGFGDLVQVVSVMDVSDSFTKILIRRSSDNGETWSQFEPLEEMYREGDDYIKFGTGSLFADPENGRMVFFAQKLCYESNRLASTWRKRRIVYRISADNGLTWSDRHQLIQGGRDSQGRPFDEQHWMEGAVYGRNMACIIASRAIRVRGEGPNEGKILLPLQTQQVDHSGELYMPTGGGYMHSGCLIGEWNDDLTDLRWDCSNHVGVSPKVSSRGVFEPSVAELPDGRMVMVMRGSNAGLQGVRGVKFQSVSHDQGTTWSRPCPLLFDDLSPMPSSSSLSLLIRVSDGRVFYCGVIAGEPPSGNWPRYPVVVAEVDPETALVQRDAVTEVVDRHGDDPKGAQYVNHWVYEDPIRNALVVLTRHYKGSMNVAVDRHIVPLSE